MATRIHDFMSFGGTGFVAKSDEEVDFFIHYLASFQLFGHTIYITTTQVCTWIVMAVIIIFAIAARRAIMKADAEAIPSGFQNIVELVVETINNFVNSTMGAHGKKYVNYVGTLFIFLFLSNISGMFGLRPPTADYATTLSLALVTFVLIQYNNIRHNKFGAFTDLFKPLPFLFPINLIGEIATPVSLSLRLFGNVMAGTVMLALYYGLLPVFAKLGVPAFLHGYFDLFSGAIQAYVFCMLTMVFVSDKMGSN